MTDLFWLSALLTGVIIELLVRSRDCIHHNTGVIVAGVGLLLFGFSAPYLLPGDTDRVPVQLQTTKNVHKEIPITVVVYP